MMQCLEDAFLFLWKHRLVTGMSYTDVCVYVIHTHTHTHTHTHCGNISWEQAKKSHKYRPGYNWPTNSVSPTPFGTSPPPHPHPKEEEETLIEEEERRGEEEETLTEEEMGGWGGQENVTVFVFLCA